MMSRILKTPGSLVFIFAVMCAGMVLTSWLVEDSFITLRVVDNFLNGYGMRWNVAERVQVFTHPLWFFILSGASFLTGDIPKTTLFMTWLVSVIAVGVVVFSLARGKVQGMIAVVAMIGSKAFMDFSSGGLENGLSHLCLAGFMVVYWGNRTGWRRLFQLCILASLLALCRFDLALLVVFALLAEFIVALRTKAATIPQLVIAATGMFPLIVWLVFSLIYYGFPFPNTAYAKLGTGIASSVLIQQGFHYLMYSVRHDVVTVAIMGGGVLYAFMKRDWRLVCIALGICVYIVYVVRAGGCFMSGRFLTVPFFAALLILVRNVEISNRRAAWLVILLLLAGAWSYYPVISVVIKRSRGALTEHYNYLLKDEHQITDEHAMFHPWTGLLKSVTHKGLGDAKWKLEGLAFREQAEKEGRVVVCRSSIGMLGFYSGPRVHIIDTAALADPLLARLPQQGRWEPGHYFRAVPEGYESSIRAGNNQIAEHSISQLYGRIKIVTTGPIWAWQRWKAIWDLNTMKLPVRGQASGCTL